WNPSLVAPIKARHVSISRVSPGMRDLMGRSGICLAALAALSIFAAAAQAQTSSGVDKLYILNCGEGVAGDISRWSPGVDVGKSMDFVDNCYLIHHDTGLDAVGYRRNRRHRRHARRPGAGRSAHDALAAAEDARLAARGARRQSRGPQ